ncbi:MAG: hypothetical protein ACLUIE_10690 [Parabacteroides merdae]
MSVGWDFTFNDGIRDRNTGIWKTSSLYATDKAVITPSVHQIRTFKTQLRPGKKKETVSVEVTNPTHSVA